MQVLKWENQMRIESTPINFQYPLRLLNLQLKKNPKYRFKCILAITKNTHPEHPTAGLRSILNELSVILVAYTTEFTLVVHFKKSAKEIYT